MSGNNSWLTLTDMKTADPDLYARVTKEMSPEAIERLHEAIEAVQELETFVKTYPRKSKNNYAAYLPFVTDPISMIVALLAGADKQGVIHAATINGVMGKLGIDTWMGTGNSNN